MRYVPFLFGGVIVFVILLLYMDASILHLSIPEKYSGHHFLIADDKPAIVSYSNEEATPSFQNGEQKAIEESETMVAPSITHKLPASLREKAVRTILTFSLQDEVDFDMKQAIQHNANWYRDVNEGFNPLGKNDLIHYFMKCKQNI